MTSPSRFNVRQSGRESVNGKLLRAETPAEMAAILDVMRRGNRFLVSSHARPDGDAVGSVLAMGMLLEQMGKQADLVSADPVPQVYRSLPGAQNIRTVRRVEGAYDAAILLECDGTERVGIAGLEQYSLINIDHHYSGSDYGDLNWIDQEAASVGEMVYRLAQAAGAHITAEMATSLYTTLLTDTGGFSYGGVQASTFAMAGDLVAAGANPVKIAQEVLYSAPMSKVLLLGAALEHLHRQGRLAWLWVTHQEMVRTCATEEDCEGIVNVALGITGVEAAAFLRELADGRLRVSLRSKGKVNVAILAERLGGGGHKRAAGCTLDGPLGKRIDEIHAMLGAELATEAV